MSKHFNPPAVTDQAEPMINARQASYALHLPYYWFADPHMRSDKKIPYYQLSRLVRFRLSELLEWQRRNDRKQISSINDFGDEA